MPWIEIIPPERAEGELARLYDGAGGARADDILRAHSLRPHGLAGHLALYRATMHHGANRLSRAFLETIAVWVSRLNGCAYCLAHHRAGLAKLVGAAREAEIWAAFEARRIDGPPFDAAERAALAYAEALTLRPAETTEAALAPLRAAGLDDGRILEINQATAYFNYANRTALGLGASAERDAVGEALDA